jgi:glycosyltransferase involved in cell wall biosynthesis
MRIAQVSPLFESVPPKLYGGTERIVHNLTEALVAMGHDVTLFASRDSHTSAKLATIDRDALRLNGAGDPWIPHFLMFEKIRRMKNNFDIIHFHTEYMHFPFARGLKTPTVTTLHGRQDLPNYPDCYAEYSDLPLVSISMNQRFPVLKANFVGNVHHGMEHGHLPFQPTPKGYLAFLGRLSPEKGFEYAVEIARKTGRKLKVAAKIEPKIFGEYLEKVMPLLDEPFVEYIGEIGDDKKGEFLGNADALLFPIQWPEPFGLVMIESIACGTPVIGFRNGSVPEILREGKSGFIVENVEQACRAVEKLPSIDRELCRLDFLRRFTSERMAEDYLAIYAQVCEKMPGVRALPSLARPLGSIS